MDGPRSSIPSLTVAAGATALCCLFALWALRSGFRRPGRRRRSCDRRPPPEMAAAAGAESEAEASMMEQLVPEITTNALSYLDYTSLCRLSMTNSAMRRAANDDAAWKALYHKDYTVEQDNIVPVNGWKSYYAATKAIISVNAEFYEIIRQRALLAMGRFWLQADYVKIYSWIWRTFFGMCNMDPGFLQVAQINACSLPYNGVIQSWALAFDWVVQGGQGIVFEIGDVRARVLTNMAWVTMKAYVDVDSGPFHMTNIYVFHIERWYMVHHHSSEMLGDGDHGQHNILG